MKIGVIGLGKLGLCLAVLFAKYFKVYGVEVNQKRIQQISNNEGFFEPKVNGYLQKYYNNLEVSMDYAVLKDCDVVFIITQTPSLPSGKFDLQYVGSALKKLHNVNPDCLAVVSSTINVGDIAKLSNIHKRVAYNPEFIKQGSIIHDFLDPKFVLIGTYNRKDGRTITNIWRKIHNKPIFILKPVGAEITKLSLNVSFTLGITFANMIGELCEKCDADSNKILDVIYQDRRNYKAGLGFGGVCFPRDVNCFKATAKENSVGSAYKCAILLNELNNYTLLKYVEKIKSYGFKRVGLLGVSYKPRVSYIDESQPIKIAEILLKEGYEIHIYDPLAEKNAKQVIPKAFFHSTLKECIEKSEILFIGTSNYSNVKTNKSVVNPWK